MGLIKWLFGENKSPEHKNMFIKESRITDIIDKTNDTEVIMAADFLSTNNLFYTQSKIHDDKSDENKMVMQYREYSQMAEVEDAVDDIINETVVSDSKGNPVKIDVGKLIANSKNVTNLYKEKIPESFEKILNIINFDDNGYDYIKRFYVDGRIYVYVEFYSQKEMLENKENAGIKNIRFLDFLRVKKVKSDKEGKKIHYEYKTDEIDPMTSKNIILKINPKNMFLFTSGLKDKHGLTISNLHKAIRPINNLKMMENAAIVYRFARASEKLMFKINVTGMSDKKANAYIQDMITNHKNRMTIDSVTGELSANSTLMAMQENYWFAERNGNSHSIDVLPSGANLGEIDDILYFLKKMYKSLNVPISRLEADSTWNFGRAEEISRDEQKFFRFIKRFRRKWENVFQKLIELDLTYSEQVDKHNWDRFIKNGIDYIWENDSVYEESAKLTKYLARVEAAESFLRLKEEHMFSTQWIRKNILKHTDEEIKQMDKEIEEEIKNQPNEELDTNNFRR